MGRQTYTILLPLLVLCSVTSVVNGQTGQTYVRLEERRERAIGKAAQQGLIALNKLMNGARLTNPKDVNTRKYLKGGGMFRAVDDFLAVSPENVRHFQDPKVFGIMGTVGDRTLVVKGGSIRPTLTISRTSEVDNPKALRHVITYRMDESFHQAP